MNFVVLAGMIAVVVIVAFVGVFVLGGNKFSNSSPASLVNGSVGVPPFFIVFLTPSQVSSVYGQTYSASSITNVSVNSYEKTYSKSYFGPSGSEIVITFDKFSTGGNATQDYNSFIGNAQSVNYGIYKGLKYEIVTSQGGTNVILVLNANSVLMIEFLKGSAVQRSEVSIMQQEVDAALS